ncbi:MAG: hypothetical protein IT200_05065 [Thermoleophilia bacterium]|nr:hypothetical protein [Thermoleophilia bacterium]
MLVVAFIGLRVSGDPKTRAKATQQDQAATVLDVIDRNLFERYGDVQAFALIRAEATRVRDDIPQVAASAEETGAAAEEVGNATTSVGRSSGELADMVGVFRVWNRGVPDRRARMRELEERDPRA